MTCRQSRPPALCGVLITAFLLAVQVVIVQLRAGEPPKPNILFMLTDDQRFDDLGSMGNRIIQTPNLDRLAADGVVFENAFVTTAICACSRASILTGQHMRRHGIRDFATPLSAPALENTYPVLLRKAGYRTAFLGKYAVGAPKSDPPNLALPSDRFDYWFGFPQQINFCQVVEGKKRHLTGLLAERAIEFIRSGPTEQPFCLSISFKSPHGPWNYFDPELPDPYQDVEIPAPPTYTREAFEAEPRFLQESLNGSKWPDSPRERFLNNARTCYRLITGVDVAVGKIMQALEQLGLDGNTVVIFTSDNGSLRGAHGLFGKWIMYEPSIRVPLIIRDPRVPADLRGSRRREMVLNIDLAPTMLAMAGVPIPPTMQGRDLGPLLAGQAVQWREVWYYEHTYNTRPPRRPIARSEGVRTTQWKYVRYIDRDPPYEQLFDLANDPLEEHNLVGVEGYQQTLADLRAKWEQLRGEAE